VRAVLDELHHRFSDRIQLIRPSGIRKLFDIAQQMDNVISLGIGEPDFDTPTHIKAAAIKAINEGYTHYTPNAGFPDLRAALAQKVAEHNNLHYESNEVIVTNGGCTGALLLAMLALVNPGDEVIISDPGFVVYDAAVRIANAIPVPIVVREDTDFRLLPEDVEKHITSKTRVLILNSPSNPTGSVQLHKDLKDLANLAQQHNFYVIADEVYEKMVYDGIKHYSIASFPGMHARTVTVNSLSKTYAMTGWRIGYATADRPIIDHMTQLQQFTMVHAPAISQRAALAALTGPQDFVDHMIQRFDERRQFLVKRLNKLSPFRCPTPKGAFYVFPNIQDSHYSSTEFAQYLLKTCNVACVPGSAFGTHGEGYLRLSYAQPIAQLNAACERIQRALRQQ
jgi:aspartate/methionine/tyrosine aminotransferase